MGLFVSIINRTCGYQVEKMSGKKNLNVAGFLFSYENHELELSQTNRVHEDILIIPNSSQFNIFDRTDHFFSFHPLFPRQ